MIRTMLTFLALLCLAVTSYCQQSIFGKWINEERNCVIEIYNKNNKAYGKIIWLKDSVDVFNEVKRDIYNENPSLRSRKLVGIDILTNMQYDGSKKWADGNIYHYDSGNTYNAKLFLNEEGHLKIKGYWWWFSFLGRVKTWVRYNG